MLPRPALHAAAEGLELLVEEAALGRGVVALLPDHRHLLAGRFEAVAGGAVERPGDHRCQAGADQAERGHRVGQRSGDRRGEEQAREDQRGPGHEHGPQAEEPLQRDQLPAETRGHVPVERGERLLELDHLLAGGDPVAEKGGPTSRLLDRGGERRSRGLRGR